MDIHLRLEGRRDLSGQIYRQLRAGIVDGRLAAGERLPSSRELADRLGVSRQTTLDVFERLSAEGFLCPRPGAGTFVAPGIARTAVPNPAIAADGAGDWLQPEAVPAHSLEFRGGVTDKRVFPFTAWRRCVNHALRVQARDRGHYGDPAGEDELRLAVSRYLGFHRALSCTPDDIIITHGAQQALDLIARIVLRPGDVVAMEDPGYPPARACYEAHGAAVVGVPVDDEGIVVDHLPPQARLVYVTPSHQFPLGMPLSLPRRIALLEWAQQRDAIIIEDDYDGEFRFEGRALEALKNLDRADRVVYVGTFSKTIFPELRIGYLVPPRTLNPSLRRSKQLADWHSASLTQTALAKFMLDGDFARHLRRMHGLYRTRRQILLSHLRQDLSPWLTPIVPIAGIHLSAMLKPGISESGLLAAAAAQSIGLYGIAGFYRAGPPQAGLLFGYGGMADDEIDAALSTLATILPHVGGYGGQP
ncbi:PLP-dependent aminotransferase family protein [Paludibacterium yongneupense]|uniref:MocR-like pyridoxine biosynthesis transcription factor PdxR n=1 Tax=Paludibacterium yongneupense TaxID=400061 RepID=UPI0004221C93|nr:PLP-dependent aminotransferase family protein [Paludibacterium yongneupense]